MIENGTTFFKKLHDALGSRKWYYLKIEPGPDPRTGEKRTFQNRPIGETGPAGLKTLLFVSSHMEDNAEVIHIHTKSKGVQGLVFAQITLEMWTTFFYLENGEVCMKTTISNLQPYEPR